MSRFRMYPTSEQAGVMLEHCAHARYVWSLAVEQHSHWYKGRKAAPGFAEQCKQLTEARRENEWLRAGNTDVMQQALKDFAKAKNAGFTSGFTSGFGEPTWRKRFKHEGFRVIGTDRMPEFNDDGTAKINPKTRKQVMGRSVVVQKLNKRWAQVKVPGCGWVRFRLTRTDWCEKTSTMLARTYDLVRFEKLNIRNMTAKAKPKADPDTPGTFLKNGRAAKAGLNRSILAQGWGLLRQCTEHKTPGRVEDVPAPYTSLRCSACGWIDKNSRKSQAGFVCSSCGFTCNADTNAATNVAAGQGGIPRPRRTAGAGGVTAATSRSSAREPQPAWAGIPLF